MTGGRVQVGEQVGSTSSTLLLRVQARAPDAWDRLVHLYGPLVYHWCRQAGLQDADAADVGQEVFRAVLGAVADFHHDRTGDSFRGWLRTITRNKVRDLARRRAKDPASGAGGSAALTRLLDVPDAPAGASDPGPDPEEQRLLHRRAVEMILADCKPETRAAFLAVVVDRRDPRAVAEELGMSLNAVYLAKSRVLRRLREEFAGLLDLGDGGTLAAPPGGT